MPQYGRLFLPLQMVWLPSLYSSDDQVLRLTHNLSAANLNRRSRRRVGVKRDFGTRLQALWLWWTQPVGFCWWTTSHLCTCSKLKSWQAYEKLNITFIGCTFICTNDRVASWTIYIHLPWCQWVARGGVISSSLHSSAAASPTSRQHHQLHRFL